MVKALEAQYLRDPLLKAIHSEELVLLPGMDQALTLNALRELDGSGQYDDIVFDGPEGHEALRMWGLPDGLDWYIRRFQAIVQSSALAQALSPFWTPIAGAIFASGRGQESWSAPMEQSRGFLDAGRDAVQNPERVMGFLVARSQTVAATRYLWGCSQQVGLTVGAVLDLSTNGQSVAAEAFAPLQTCAIPSLVEGNWSPLMAALPDVDQVTKMAPRSLTLDTANNQVRLFLPGFDKSQIGLTQSGPEVTIDAGNQRRNLYLPEPFKNRAVRGAKFQENALILSF
ncbi:MAG: ArsA family ATPase [Leptolyngbya sp. RL_3_1]|nr:ArsA family ATPase [Leptolyngbya sp. RL_3_1]